MKNFNKFLKLSIMLSFVFGIFVQAGYSYAILNTNADVFLVGVNNSNIKIVKNSLNNIEGDAKNVKNFLSVVGSIDNFFAKEMKEKAETVLKGLNNKKKTVIDKLDNVLFTINDVKFSIVSFLKFSKENISKDFKLIDLKLHNLNNSISRYSFIYLTFKKSFLLRNLRNNFKVFSSIVKAELFFIKLMV